MLLFPLYLADFYSYPSFIFLALQEGTAFFIRGLRTTVLQLVVSCWYGVQSVLLKCLPLQWVYYEVRRITPVDPL